MHNIGSAKKDNAKIWVRKMSSEKLDAKNDPQPKRSK